MKLKQNVLFGNIAALAILQLATYITPLLIVPYLTRVLGPGGYGTVAICLSMIQMSLILTDFGFNLSSTEYIARNCQSKDKINKHIGAVFQIKILLIFLCVIFLYFLVNDQLQQFKIEFFFYSCIAIIGQTFQSLWFFQGVEKMKRITLFLTISKFSYVILTFVIVKKPEQGRFVILAYALSQVIGALLSQYYMRKEGYKYTPANLSSMLGVLRTSALFFWSRLAVSTYTTASTLVVGAAGHVQAGYYAASEQLYKAGQNITTPVSQALYPYMTRAKNWALFFKMMSILTVVMITASLTAIWLSQWLIALIFGPEYIVSQNVFIVFMLALIVTFVSTNFGYPVFSALGKVKVANYTVIFGALTHVVILGVLFCLGEISAYNVVRAVLFTEIVILILRMFFFVKLYRREVK
ncbi:putative polisoprenol-linked O-antigen transporter [Escherichia coli]|uniref:O28ac/O42 family O-antigen flippase n=1 Tax=Escherichia coli TaxID=562 RepID=UPI000F6F5553|nr:O28ac/O42 family O-antigen flippase [Escherichia coli]VEC67940.1 putative polisoprenol-linked O-antigen transporter [Escherichia coli]